MPSKAEASAEQRAGGQSAGGQKSELARLTSESELELRPQAGMLQAAPSPLGLGPSPAPAKLSSASLWSEEGDAHSRERFWSASTFQRDTCLWSLGRVKGEEETDTPRPGRGGTI